MWSSGVVCLYLVGGCVVGDSVVSSGIVRLYLVGGRVVGDGVVDGGSVGIGAIKGESVRSSKPIVHTFPY